MLKQSYVLPNQWDQKCITIQVGTIKGVIVTNTEDCPFLLQRPEEGASVFGIYYTVK